MMAASTSGSTASSTQMTGPSPLRRRRLSRGLIAAGAGAGGNQRRTGSSSDGGEKSTVTSPPQQGDESSDNNIIASPPPSNKPFPIESSTEGGDINNMSGNSGGKPSSSSLSTPIINLPTKADYSGKLALSCVENALKMGVITKFSLCPMSGKARKNLIIRTKASRSGATAKTKNKRGSNNNEYEKAEEIFLQNPPYRETEEGGGGGEYSSGDEDDYDASIINDNIDNNIRNMSSSSKLPLHHNHNINNLNKEPYFIPTATESASMGLQGGGGLDAGSMNPISSLPFNYRKIQYFDNVTATDRGIARQFLQSEIKRAQKLRSMAILNHLKNIQSREKEGELYPPSSENSNDNNTAAVDLRAEQHSLQTALSRFPHEMTSILSAALLIESLAMNTHESMEGMGKCYDAIVSAGTALLDSNSNLATSSSSSPDDNNNNDQSSQQQQQGGGGKKISLKKKLSTSQIMSALAPLLITSLSQSTGETLVALGQLRNYCGTRRYQRRFVQRIAPYLVRPPDHASIWCLRHQNDIESIIAAVEMILMNASEVFSMGWYELGQSMLTDTRRAESLRTAANQLCQLNSMPSNTMASDGGGGLLVGLSSSTPGSSFGLRRSFLGGGRKEGGISIISNDSLAEWEVMAIDKGIRQSVLDVFSRDWGRISTLNLSTKDDAVFGSRASRRGVGISSVKSKEWDTGSAASGGGSIGPSSSSQVISGMAAAASITKSPRSTHSKLPLSPRNTTSTVQLPSADALESTFGPSFSSQDEVEEGENNRSTSPLPTAPLSPRRDVSSKRLASEAPKTPPTLYQEARDGTGAGADNDSRISSSHPPQHSSPGRSSLDPPLSPQSSIGAGSTSTIGTHKSTNQMSSTTTREQYRALTSTSADRKRTVAACRALRAQITQFEDAFAQIHGRTPKGAAERAPLASTYMQYREWKRAIRADAACRIQALCRGARLRMVLSQSDDPAKTRFILKQQRARKSRSSSSSPKPLNHLRIPLDMDGGGDDGADSGGLSLTRLETRSAASQRGEDDSVEVFPVQPKWRDRPQRSSSSSNRSQQQQQQQQSPSGGGSSSPRAASSHSSPHRSSRRSGSSSSLPDVSVMSLAELGQRKRELKQQLKLYDMNFHKQHGRMPEKREKEPIRHLYESYNAYKSQITVIEKGEAQPGPGTAAFRGVSEAAASAAAPPSPPVPDIVSPTHVASPPDSPPNQPGHFRRTSSGENSFGTDSMVMSASQSEANTAAPAPAPSEVSPSQDLASLKAEKGTLHQMLRSYEKDFFKQHKRQVSSFADIRPVAGQYRRYKEIKKAIAQKTMSTTDAT